MINSQAIKINIKFKSLQIRRRMGLHERLSEIITPMFNE